MNIKAKSTQRGFTVLELMIATGIFSTLLLVILAAVTQIGRMYYKGVTSSRTQEATRQVLEKVTQEIQYSGSDAWNSPQKQVGAGKNVICVGNSRLFWVTNQVKTTTNYGLWTDDSNSGAGSCDPATTVPTVSPGATNPRELLPDGMRIVKFNLTNVGSGLWQVTLRVVYWTGPDGELDTSSGIPETRCGTGSGSTFCSVSELSSTVYKRL